MKWLDRQWLDNLLSPNDGRLKEPRFGHDHCNMTSGNIIEMSYFCQLS
jgi:hypothetical protein